MTFLQSIQKMISREVILFRHYSKIAHKLEQKIDSSDMMSREEKKYSALDEEKLERCLKDEHQRTSTIEEKTFKLFLSFSFIVTILIPALALLQRNINMLYEIVQKALTIIIVVCLLYIFFASFIALQAIRTQKIYGYGANFSLERQNKGKQILVGALVRQELMNTRISNRNEIASMAMRNVFILVFVGSSILGITLLWEYLSRLSGL